MNLGTEIPHELANKACKCLAKVTHDELGGSSWLYELHGIKAGKPPVLNLKHESALQKVFAGETTLHDINKVTFVE